MIVLLHWKTSCRDLIRRSHSCQQGANRFEIAHLNSTRHFLRGFLPKIEETFGQSWFVKSWPYQQFRWNQWYWMEFYFYWFNPTHHQEMFFYSTWLGVLKTMFFQTISNCSRFISSKHFKKTKIHQNPMPILAPLGIWTSSSGSVVWPTSPKIPSWQPWR